MKSIFFNLHVIATFLISILPCPGPLVFNSSCPRDNARIVRKIVQNKWTPILEKFKVTLLIDCPFHPQRDIFRLQQAAKKQHRQSQWTCGLCGKSFFDEKYLDMHFDNRHKKYINIAEDAVCLADYCDIMRCDVLNNHDFQTAAYPNELNTDIEIWREVSKALITSQPKKVSKKLYSNLQQINKNKNCLKLDDVLSDHHHHGSDNDKSFNNSNSICTSSDMIDSALPSIDNKQQKIAELHQLKANCKPEELQKIKTKCEILVRDCIAGLLIHISNKDFKEIEDELNRAVCWYLTCERYWEDTRSDMQSFPWGLLCMIIMVLSLSICLCYYVIWVVFDSDDGSTTMTDRSTPSPAHIINVEGPHHHQLYSEDYYLANEKDNEYIYVTYPPDLKRRLLESCYNRTTRL